MSAIIPTYAQGRNGTIVGLVDNETGASHKVHVTRWFMTRRADKMDGADFAGEDEHVFHGHRRGQVTISGWVLNNSSANPGVNALGGAGVSSTLTSDTGRTYAGTLKSYHMQHQWDEKSGKQAILIRANFDGAITETWS